jgi:hypothetical protein
MGTWIFATDQQSARPLSPLDAKHAFWLGPSGGDDRGNLVSALMF